jgi:hypothetical protein
MASATGIPQATPDEIARRESAHDPAPAEGLADDEPLLGRRGAVSQREGQALGWNLIIGIYFPIPHTAHKPANT